MPLKACPLNVSLERNSRKERALSAPIWRLFLLRLMILVGFLYMFFHS